MPRKDMRAAVEAAYVAELPHRTGRVWAAVDAHQIPFWGRGKSDHFQKGWSGLHSRRLRGYRLFLVVGTETGQIITYILARGRNRDAQLMALLAHHLRRPLGRRLAGVVADCGFTSRAAIAALVDGRVPFILGFARSKPIEARLAALCGQQRRWFPDGERRRQVAVGVDLRFQLDGLGHLHAHASGSAGDVPSLLRDHALPIIPFGSLSRCGVSCRCGAAGSDRAVLSVRLVMPPTVLAEPATDQGRLSC